MTSSSPSHYRESAIYRRLAGEGKAIHNPISKLRALFAVGLGRHYPVPQLEFAHWCGASRDTIIVAETNPESISKRLAVRIWEISGAELSWLSGQRPVEDFDYQHLIEWYPGKIPGTVKLIEALHGYSSTDFAHVLNYICVPLGLDCLASGRSPSLPCEIFKAMEDKFRDWRTTSQGLPKWMSAAFAPNMVAIKTAVKWGMLDDAPGIDTDFYRKVLKVERKAAKPDGKVWSELIHKVTALCGKELREGPRPSERGTTKPIDPKPIEPELTLEA